MDPLRSSPTLAAMDWPGDIGSITMKGHAREPPSTVAVTWYAPTLAKESGTTPEAIQAVVERCPGLLF